MSAHRPRRHLAVSHPGAAPPSTPPPDPEGRVTRPRRAGPPVPASPSRYSLPSWTPSPLHPRRRRRQAAKSSPPPQRWTSHPDGSTFRTLEPPTANSPPPRLARPPTPCCRSPAHARPWLRSPPSPAPPASRRGRRPTPGSAGAVGPLAPPRCVGSPHAPPASPGLPHGLLTLAAGASPGHSLAPPRPSELRSVGSAPTGARAR